MAGGIDAQLQRIAGPGAPSVATGVVTKIETHESYGYLLTVRIQPGDENDLVQARLCASGSGAGQGIYWPVAVGDEVLLVFPDGDRMRAVAIPGLTSGAAKPPSGWNNDHVEVVQPNGMTVRRTEGANTSPVVTATILPELLKFVNAVIVATGGGSPDMSNFGLRLIAEVDKTDALFVERRV